MILGNDTETYKCITKEDGCAKRRKPCNIVLNITAPGTQ